MEHFKNTYQDAGVDIMAGNALVENIKPIARSTHQSGVLGGIGGFAALFEMPKGYHEPVLVSCTDGVGTKLKLAQELGAFHTIGIDLVAMCVNDLIVCGAKPLFFLDYYASGKLNVLEATSVIQGIAQGLKQASCALVGGETAEMPGLYAGHDFDLAGFCVGVVEKTKILDGQNIQIGDIAIALPSSGPHSNGYSLIRKIIADKKVFLSTSLDNEKTLGEALIEPTRIYVSTLMPLLEQNQIKGMAHITGGGLTENIPRILPKNVSVMLRYCVAQWPLIFQWLQSRGEIATPEMLRTFNCGIGMVLFVAPSQADAVLQHCPDAFVIGEVIPRQDESVIWG